MRNGLVTSALACALLTLAVAARAEDAAESLDDLDLVKLLNVQVSTATKTVESVEEAPAVTRVVTREEIRRWGYQTLADVLEHTLGFYLVDDHILPNAGVRGVTGGLRAESGVIKVMIDGRSVAYRTTSGNWLGVELIPLETVQQIEIIRGPASALYGADAFLGVVNIIRVKPEDVRPLSAQIVAGQTSGHPEVRLDVAGGGRFGAFDWLLGVAGEIADLSGLSLPSESPAPTLPADVGDRRTALDLRRRSLALESRLGYRNEAGYLEFSAHGSAIRRGGDFAQWSQLAGGSADDAGTVVALGQLRLDLDGLVHASRELDLALQSSYFRGGVLPSDRIDVASDLFHVERHEAYHGVDSMAEARWIPSPRFNLILGAEAVYDHESFGNVQRVSELTGEAVADSGVPDPNHRLFNVGGYVSSNVKVIPELLKLTGGLRYDHHNQYGSQLTGRFGATSRWSRSVVAKLLYGSAFKAPSPYLLYAVPLRLGDVVGNPRLKPQRIQTVETQISYTPQRLLELSSDVSYSWLLDKAEFTPQGTNQTARNVADQRSLAWETRADLHYHDVYTAYGSFELVHSLRDLGQRGYAAELVGDKNVVYPPWIVRAGLLVGVPLPSVPLEAGVQGMLVGPRRAADTTLLESGGEVTFPTYLLLDASLATRALYPFPGHESRVALRGKNLLGARGPDPGFSGFEYPLTPRELFLEFEYIF